MKDLLSVIRRIGRCSGICMVAVLPVKAQEAGKSSYGFLQAPVSARMAALGGTNVSLSDRDVNFFFSNPAVNGDSLSGFGSVNYQFYAGSVGHAAIAYAHTFPKAGTLTLGLQHMNYGEIAGYDESGIETGTFHASETALMVSRAHQSGHFRLGLTAKGVFANLAGNRSVAAAVDIGGVFVHANRRLTAGLSLRNVGVVLSDFSATAASRLPFDVQAGSTFKPEYMPVRFSLTAYNLTGIAPEPADGDALSPVQKVFSHIIIGSEILLHRNVNVLAGYNYRLHRNLITETGGGGAGISLGFSATIGNFDFVFSRSAFMAGNAAYSFTLSGNMNKYLKRE